MIALNFRWPTPSTVLKNSDPPHYFPSPPPPPPFTLWPVPNYTCPSTDCEQKQTELIHYGLVSIAKTTITEHMRINNKRTMDPKA
jgi:hypothetical protein